MGKGLRIDGLLDLYVLHGFAAAGYHDLLWKAAVLQSAGGYQFPLRLLDPALHEKPRYLGRCWACIRM